jgi:AraC-like DNA-binding protein
MRVDATPLLERRRVFESQDPEEVRAFMHTKEFELDFSPRESGAFDFVASAAYLPNAYIGYIRYGAAVRVRVPAERKRDDYFIHLPVRGTSEVVNRAGSAVCARGHAVISSPSGHLMRSEHGSERVTVSLTKSAIIGQLAALLGDVPVRPLEFAPSIDLTCAEGRRFSRQVRLVIADLDDHALGRNPLLLGMYEQLIITGLLLCQCNTYIDALCRLEKNAAPRDVKRVIDYIQGHLDAPITLADLVAASGVPGRTLLKHFKDHRGTTPMRYLREARLGRAREALLRAEAAESVTQVAMAWGFQHLGRFAIDYRRRFGESPSETCKRGRGRTK